MITQLYIFSPGSYVVAEEWNANFRVLLNTNLVHQESIVDAGDIIMTTSDDYTQIYNAVNSKKNSQDVAGLSIQVLVDNEYRKSLSSGQKLVANVGRISGEARIILQTAQDDVLQPLQINYAGGSENVVWENGIAQWYAAGMKFVFLLERNGKLYVKMIATE